MRRQTISNRGKKKSVRERDTEKWREGRAKEGQTERPKRGMCVKR